METLTETTHLRRKIWSLLLIAVLMLVSASNLTVQASDRRLDAAERAYVDRMYPLIDQIADEVATEHGLDQEGRAFSKIVAMTQAGLETGWGTSALCRTKHNHFGTDAYDVTVEVDGEIIIVETALDHARSFASDEESVRYYFEHLIEGYPGTIRRFYKNGDPYAYVERLGQFYARDENYSGKNSDLIDAVARYLAEREVADADAAWAEAAEIEAAAMSELARAVDNDTAVRQEADRIMAEVQQTEPVGATAGIVAYMSQLSGYQTAFAESQLDVVGANVSVVAATAAVDEAEVVLEEARSYLDDSEPISTLVIAVERGRISLDSLSESVRVAVEKNL